MQKNAAPNGLWIDRQDVLQDFFDSVLQSSWLALDTEFLRTHTYYPKLCLIQVSDGARHALIDAQAGLDLAALLQWLRKPGATSVFHACQQDTEILHHDFDTIPDFVFDTQVAWSLLGRGFQTSYAKLVAQKLGIKLDKSQVRSRWDRRPLSKAQIRYALLDVIHLAPLYQQLAEELEARGRQGWMQEEMQRLLSPANWVPDPEQIWRRIPTPGGGIPRARLHVLKGLACWRELKARSLDLARPRVMPDATTVDLACAPPASREEFNRKVQHSVAGRVQDELWDVLQQVEDHPPLPAGRSVDRNERMEQREKVRQLARVAREIAQDLQVSPELLAPRAMLEELVQQRPNSSLLRGWRGQTVGHALTEALHAL